jgi:hypothetical protein
MMRAVGKSMAHTPGVETPIIPDEPDVLDANREARFVTDSSENFLEAISLGLYRA